MPRLLAPAAILFVFVVLLAGCGQNKVIVSPASADAQNYPNGIVQFTSTGVSSPTWCIGTSGGQCDGNVALPATIDSSGRAQCASGHSGTVTVLAGKGVPPMNFDTGFQLSPFGSAQLTCP